MTALKAGDTAGARSRLMLWTKAGGRTLAGLVNRREAEARLIIGGVYGEVGPTPEAAPAQPSAEVRALQADLATLGFFKGAVDGLARPVTTAAIRAERVRLLSERAPMNRLTAELRFDHK